MKNILLFDNPHCAPTDMHTSQGITFDYVIDLSTYSEKGKQELNTSQSRDLITPIISIPPETWKHARFYVMFNDKKSISLLFKRNVSADSIFILDRDNKNISDAIRTDRANWQIFNNIHIGKRAFILGNGPSLKITDLDLLGDEITFASNKIYLAFDHTNWRPTYYNVADELVAFYNSPTIQTVNSCRIIMQTVKKYFPDEANVLWMEELMDNTVLKETKDPYTFSNERLFFSTDCRKGLQAGWTIIYNQLQLAFCMGIREVFLIGVDFSFDVPPSIVDSKIYGKAVESHGEINHFHKDYRKPGEKWAIPNLDYQHKMFEKARDVYKQNGGIIYNASRTTRLDVFPRIAFESIFDGKSLKH